MEGTDILKTIDRNKDGQQQGDELQDNYIGSGMDCAVIPLKRHNEYSLVQTVDFFYPLVDDPHMMGKIALANVVSDVYAVGVTVFDKLQMLISAPTELSEQQRDIVVPMIIDGFRDAAKLAGIEVSIQSIMLNPWCIIGGIATSVCKQEEIIMPSNAREGDVIVLTKPLGTHLATNAFIWMQEQNEKYKKLAERFTREDIGKTYRMALASMSYLNRNAALLMHKHCAHAATDVTGFGLLGHAKNLAEFQRQPLHFEIHTLPILQNVLDFGKILQQDTKLRAGKAVETSGGLLICLPAENSTAFCTDFEAVTNGDQKAWIVGRVLKADKRGASLIESPKYIEATI